MGATGNTGSRENKVFTLSHMGYGGYMVAKTHLVCFIYYPSGVFINKVCFTSEQQKYGVSKGKTLR